MVLFERETAFSFEQLILQLLSKLSQEQQEAQVLPQWYAVFYISRF